VFDSTDSVNAKGAAAAGGTGTGDGVDPEQGWGGGEVGETGAGALEGEGAGGSGKMAMFFQGNRHVRSDSLSNLSKPLRTTQVIQKQPSRAEYAMGAGPGK
jgi:hypothetical protein